MKKEALIMVVLAIMAILVPLLFVEGPLHKAASGIGIFFGACSLVFGLVVFFDKPMNGKHD